MNNNFSIDEVFELAEQIERNGYDFYKKAAEICPDHKEFLLELAQQEAQHENFFADLRRKKTKEIDNLWKSDVDSIALSYVQALSENYVFADPQKMLEKLSQLNTIEEIISFAISIEKENILFFNGIKDVMTDEESINIMTEMIREEVQHVLWLRKYIHKQA